MRLRPYLAPDILIWFVNANATAAMLVKRWSIHQDVRSVAKTSGVSKMTKSTTACVAIFLLSLSSSVALAQGSAGSIVGTVTDPTGALVHDVRVTLTNLATGTKVTTVSNRD